MKTACKVGLTLAKELVKSLRTGEMIPGYPTFFAKLTALRLATGDDFETAQPQLCVLLQGFQLEYVLTDLEATHLRDHGFTVESA